MSGPDDPHRPHRRRNPLTGRHVIVSPHRAQRPWLGQEDAVAPAALPSHDPDCYLCPGNSRAGGAQNPDYAGPWVFDNDFPALLDNAPPHGDGADPLFARSELTGTCRVLCFSADHAASLPHLSPAGMRAVVDCWCEEAATLGRTYRWVQIFENKGAMMGCSNPHPHGQIWATDFLPDEAALEDANQRAYLTAHGRPMLSDVADREAADGARTIIANDDWIVVTPFWASWPFETLLLPRFAIARLPDLAPERRETLACIIQQLTRGYDALFGVSFPYSMGWHGAPFDGDDHRGWQLHAHFYPPLLRSATVRKFMVGYEMLAEAQRDLTPEQAAARLRDAVSQAGVT